VGATGLPHVDECASLGWASQGPEGTARHAVDAAAFRSCVPAESLIVRLVAGRAQRRTCWPTCRRDTSESGRAETPVPLLGWAAYAY
jgi:hypothetical protein